MEAVEPHLLFSGILLPLVAVLVEVLRLLEML